MSFTTEIHVRFAHVDAAGIVFYPRYLEMVNETVERWFEQGLDLSFRELIVEQRHGVPTKRLVVDFTKPSRLGDKLTFTLRVNKVGRSSIDLRVDAACGGEARLTAEVTLVYVTADPVNSTPIPDELRRKMLTFAKSA